MALLGSASKHITLRNAMLMAVALRVGLLIYGDYHDRHSSLKYTDVDYRVFSDASRFIAHPSAGNFAQGFVPRMLSWSLGDPYTRATYRYTPLLALLTLPNEHLHPVFGKILFALCDLLIGFMLYRISLRAGNAPMANAPQSPKVPSLERAAPEPQRPPVLLIAALWLLNPMVANISTRGSAESVLGAMVIATHFLILSDRLDWAAIMFGLSVHFKIYPIIYGASIIAWIDQQNPIRLSWRSLTRKRIRFALISTLSFVSLSGIMFSVWGNPFLEHTYLYHLTRRDHRHNFSPYFYPIYLNYDRLSSKIISPSRILRSPLFSFLPQMLLCMGSGLLLARKDLSFAWFIQTMIFVTFNKVCTSQYFMWYLWFLPLVLPKLQMSARRGVAILLIWVVSQAAWLGAAFRLELLGESMYGWVWVASVLFLLSNGFVLGELITAHKSSSIHV